MNGSQGDPPNSNNWNAQPGGFAPMGPSGADPYRQNNGPARGVFLASGGAILAAFLLLKIAPVAVEWIFGGAYAVTHDLRTLEHDQTYKLVTNLISLVSIPLGVIYCHEVVKFEWNHAVIDGRKVRYNGTFGQFLGALFLPGLAALCTFGIAAPWLMCAYYRYIFEHCDVEGSRLEFNGQGGDFFGTYWLNTILGACSFGIYIPWATCNMWEWYWQHTTLNGRPFGFRNEGGDFFGVALLHWLLSVCTLGIYWPWALATYRKWELDHLA